MIQCNAMFVFRPVHGLVRFLTAASVICGLTVPGAALAVGPDEEREDELAELHRQIKAGHPGRAIEALLNAAERDSDNADIHNLLGFGYRRMDKLSLARRHYQRALALFPGHRGALEYLGELELREGDRAAAEKHLATLERLCPCGCQELDDLREALARH